ncbi:hypothetical protein D9M68_848150 [compost metagenome]
MSGDLGVGDPGSAVGLGLRQQQPEFVVAALHDGVLDAQEVRGHCRRFLGAEALQQVVDLAVDLGVADGLDAVTGLVGRRVGTPNRPAGFLPLLLGLGALDLRLAPTPFRRGGRDGRQRRLRFF